MKFQYTPTRNPQGCDAIIAFTGLNLPYLDTDIASIMKHHDALLHEKKYLILTGIYHLVLISKQAKYDDVNLYQSIAQELKQRNVKSVFCDFAGEVDVRFLRFFLGKLAEIHVPGFIQKSKPATIIDTVKVYCNDNHQDAKNMLDYISITSTCAARSKYYSDAPGTDADAEYMTKECEKLKKISSKIKINVLDADEILKLKMMGIYNVGKAARERMRFVIIEYNYDGNTSPYVLVGKGVTFDTGGLSLKTGPHMYGMHEDMTGAAVCMQTVSAVAQLKLDIPLVALLGFVENAISPEAYKPGDIVTTMKGVQVEITNTDAEGRMVLCDLLTYAERYKPKSVINLATLTGAILICLGTLYSGAYVNDEHLFHDLNQASSTSGDLIWRMPLHPEYVKILKKDCIRADIFNADLQPMMPGSNTAAAFLSLFTDKYPWAHLDIAGSSTGNFNDANGRPLNLLVQYFKSKIDG